MPNTILDKDLITGFSSDPSRPFIERAELAHKVRWDGKKFVDCTKRKDWLIDDVGNKRLPSMHPNSDLQALSCSLDAVLLKDEKTGNWRVKTQAEFQAEAVAQAEKEAIAGLRRHISQNVADTESLLGTVADGVGLLIAIALADVVALSSATDFDTYKTAKLNTLTALAGDADLAVLAGGALQQIQTGDVVLTASLKGLDNVIAESLTRSTAVATILSRAAKQQAPGE